MIRFYHLTRSPVETALARLLSRAFEAGHRTEVRGTDRDRLDWLDRKLWLGPDDGFLPHGLAGGPHDARQPILLTERSELADNTTCLMVVDGAEIDAAETKQLERTCILFDGGDAAALDRARDQWRALTGAGLGAEYWSEESGQWKLKTSAPPQTNA
ncbi:MAG: DNA polymerase III subunit chi [Pseudomonadota bacterium]